MIGKGVDGSDHPVDVRCEEECTVNEYMELRNPIRQRFC